MNNRQGQPQRRGINYEKKKVKDHGRKHLGGPGKLDAPGMEVKDWKNPVPKPEVIKAKRKGVTKFISKSGFTVPALEYGKKTGIKLYKGPKRVA